MDIFGFIVTRHVNSELTNKYWNHCVKLLRTLYPYRKIIIIDDNSNYDYVKSEFNYKNLEIIQSEYFGRGELLPYYYFLKYKFRFIHKHIFSTLFTRFLFFFFHLFCHISTLHIHILKILQNLVYNS